MLSATRDMDAARRFFRSAQSMINATPKQVAKELEKFASYVDRGGAKGDKKQALADVFWVLLNSPEFLFNH